MFWVQYAGQGTQDIPPEAAAAFAGIMVVAILIGIIVGLGVQAIFCYLYSLLLKRVPKEFRQMEPGMVWLSMIPIFNYVWMFFVVLRISGSYKRYFDSKGNTTVGDCGHAVGLGYCICVCCAIIPYLNCLALPAALVLFIIYLVKMFGFKNQIPENEAATQG